MGTVFLLIFTVSRAELCLLYFLLIVYSIEDLLNWTLCLSLQCAVFPLFFLLMYKMYNNLIVGFSWENLQYISPLLYSLSLWSIDLSIAILVEVWQGSFDFHIIISFFFKTNLEKAITCSILTSCCCCAWFTVLCESRERFHSSFAIIPYLMN